MVTVLQCDICKAIVAVKDYHWPIGIYQCPVDGRTIEYYNADLCGECALEIFRKVLGKLAGNEYKVNNMVKEVIEKKKGEKGHV